jgi:hypothetical protein
MQGVTLVNASVSALPREEEVQSKIRKIRAFGRNARSVCAVLFGLGLVLGAVLVLVVVRAHVSAPNSGNSGGYDGGLHDVLSSPLTPLQLKVWALLGLGVAIGVWLAALRQLHRLFGNLAAGAIYTPENVRRVRHVGLLWLLSAVLYIAFPASLVVANGLLDVPVPIDFDRVFPSFWELLSAFAAAGLVLLVSWIMDVGLYEKEHADALRRDADLVI